MKKNKKTHVALTETQRSYIENLIQNHKTLVYYTIRSVLRKGYGYLAEECVSELYLLMCQKVQVLETHPNPKAWMIVAAKLTAFSVIKKYRHDSSNVPLENSKASKIDSTYEEALYSIWLENDVATRVLAGLTKRETQIYHKLYIENKSTLATARELDISVSTVRSFKKLIKDKIEFKVRKNI